MLVHRYCTQNDRRFYTEINHGVKPAGRSQLTNAEGEVAAPPAPEPQSAPAPTPAPTPAPDAESAAEATSPAGVLFSTNYPSHSFADGMLIT